MAAVKTKPPLSWSERGKIATIARRYYSNRETQSQIAKDLGTSQTEISRYLELAREHGIIRIDIDDVGTETLKDKLLQTFAHLKEVRVVSLIDMPGSKSGDALFLQTLGMEGARYLLATLPHGASLGISCGYSVAAMVTALGQLRAAGEALPIASRVFPLVILMTPELVQVTPAALVATLVEYLPEATGRVFQLPTAETKQEYQFYKSRKQIQQLLDDITQLDSYVVGLGMIDALGKLRPFRYQDHRLTHEFNALIQRLNLVDALRAHGAMGEALYQPFDREGHFLIEEKAFTPLRHSILCLPLEILRQHVQAGEKRVIAIAGGSIKHEAIWAALRARLCNVLITDSGTAEFLLKAEGVLPSPLADEPQS